MPYLNHEDFAAVHAALETIRTGSSVNPPDHMTLLGAIELMDKAKAGVASPGLRELANDLYGTDEVEIDDEGVGTSASDEGTWVQAWVWVSLSEQIEAGLVDDPDDESICATPGCPEDASDGEGFDGYCGTCADKREASGEVEHG